MCMLGVEKCERAELHQNRSVEVKSFFDEQNRRRKQTYFYVTLGLIWMVIMGCLLVDVHASLFRQFDARIPQDEVRQWCMIVSGITVGLWGLVAIVLLTSSSRVLPLVIGAHVARETDKRVLENVLEEVKIASEEADANIRWHILETPIQNAFACGRSTKDGSIVVTRGLLNVLNRNELQTVIAHELAHLKNGDSQFIASALAFAWMVVGVCLAACAVLIMAVTLMVLGMVVISKIVQGGNGIAALIVVLVCVGLFIAGLFYLAAYALMLAVLLGLVAFGVKAASSSISQSREYLADACAAQWTRNPLALASALAKISGHSKIADTKGTLVAPLWLDSPSAGKDDKITIRLLSFLLNTHPDVERRLQVLREMAGSTAVTDGRWLTRIQPTKLQRIKEWALPAVATIIAVAVAILLIRDLLPL